MSAELLPGEIRCADGIIRRKTTTEVLGYDVSKEKLPVEIIMGPSGCAEIKIQQSTPEDISAWLNAQSKSSFKSEVVTEGEDKVLRTSNAKGHPLYAFQYIGGSPSCMVQCYDEDDDNNGNGFRHAPVEIKEYADEWACTYIPTSHVERITVGGTALFAPEELV